MINSIDNLIYFALILLLLTLLISSQLVFFKVIQL